MSFYFALYAKYGFAASETATIKNLRISNNSDKVRIVVDADKEVDYQSFALSSPDRVVIDLNDAALAKNIEKEVDINSKYASKVRVAQFKDNVVRVVVETDVKNLVMIFWYCRWRNTL